MEIEADQRPRVVVIMPARNCARTLEATCMGIPDDLVDGVVLVDNASRDDTVATAERLGLTVVRHGTDRGYGGSLKTCLRTALGLGPDFILELHPDNQYDPAAIPDLLRAARSSPDVGIALGSRFLPPRRALEGGMPRWKFLSNRALTAANGLLLGVRLSEFHTGFRVYRAEMVRRIPFERNSDDFLFSFQILAQSLRAGFRLAEVPAYSTYFDGASSNPLGGSIRYGLGTLWASVQCLLDRTGLLHFAYLEPVAERAPAPGR